MVGLGPPLEREEPLLAGMTAYLEEEPESAGGEQRTLVGFPPAPVPLEDETAAEPEETPNDAITDLGTLPGSNFSSAFSVNSGGIIVGVSVQNDAFRAVVWR